MCVAYPLELKRVIGTLVAVLGAGIRISSSGSWRYAVRGEHVVAALVLDIRRDIACNEDSYA
jgi:hypothetical protein